jgi:hypothetical protein
VAWSAVEERQATAITRPGIAAALMSPPDRRLPDWAKQLGGIHR